MNRSRTFVLGALLLLAGATSAFAQRGNGGYGGRGGFHAGRGFAQRGYGGGFYGRGYAPSLVFRGGFGPGFGGYRAGPGAFRPGRFYAGRGYFYGNRFWARPYYGVGVGIPYGWGYRGLVGCGFYDGWGYWQPAPCYPY